MRLLLVVLALSLALPAGASAAAGSTTLDLGGRAFDSLRAAGVRIVPERPARLARRELRLPVRDGLITSVALLNHRGTIRLRRSRGPRGRDRGARALTLGRVQVRLGRVSRVTATVRDRRLRLFSIRARRGAVALDQAAGTASLRGARVMLTRAGARAIARRLGLARLRPGRFGTITVDALLRSPPPSPGAPGSPSPGPPSGGPPSSPPISDEPPVPARPPGAADVGGATIVWHVRDSWVRYASTEQDAVPLGGAVPGPAIPQEQHACPDAPAAAAPPPLVYAYTVPFAHGWHDAAGGRTALYTRGGARFVFPSHGIDLQVVDLEVEINGAASRLIARFDGRDSTRPGNNRAVLANLSGPPPAPGGAPVVLKGTIPEGGSESVFAGFYGAGDGFGCVTVSYTL
jgi:Htaa